MCDGNAVFLLLTAILGSVVYLYISVQQTVLLMVKRASLCPLAQEAHQDQASHKADEADTCLERAGVGERSVEPLHKPHLGHTDPQQDACTESIESANGD